MNGLAGSNIETVGIVGSGVMGQGIAHAFLLKGVPVILTDVNDAIVKAGRDRIRRSVIKTAERGKLSEPVDSVLERLTTLTAIEALRACNLVIEAVPEDPKLKVTILAKIAGVVDDGATIASNTSSISIASLAPSVRLPGRFLGLHFFNPVPASQLIEIVVGPDTDQDVVSSMAAVGIDLEKEVIVVKDSPGFASSRLGVLLGLEAIRMLEEGVASPEHIDLAMTAGYRHPIGPLHLTDLVGLDIRLGVAEYLASKLGPRFEPPLLLRDMVARGQLGRKSGSGFFDYTDVN